MYSRSTTMQDELGSPGGWNVSQGRQKKSVEAGVCSVYHLISGTSSVFMITCVSAGLTRHGPVAQLFPPPAWKQPWPTPCSEIEWCVRSARPKRWNDWQMSQSAQPVTSESAPPTQRW